MPINLSTASAGIIQISGINISYNGSQQINVTASSAGNANYSSCSQTYYLNSYYSKFSKSLPYAWMNNLVFRPDTNSSKNVSMYGQTASKPAYNITGQNYGTGMDIAIRVNSTMDSCMNMTAGSSNTVFNITKVNTTWQMLYSNVLYGQSKGAWLKMNYYDCNNSADYSNSWFEISSCCYGCLNCWG